MFKPNTRYMFLPGNVLADISW